MTSASWSSSIVWYERRQLVEFDARWRDAVRSRLRPLATNANALEIWEVRAQGLLLFAAVDGSCGGEIHLDGPPVPEPSAVLDLLGVNVGWIFAPDLSWAVRTDHDHDLGLEMFGSAE